MRLPLFPVPFVPLCDGAVDADWDDSRVDWDEAWVSCKSEHDGTFHTRFAQWEVRRTIDMIAYSCAKDALLKQQHLKYREFQVLINGNANSGIASEARQQKFHCR